MSYPPRYTAPKPRRAPAADVGRIPPPRNQRRTGRRQRQPARHPAHDHHLRTRAQQHVGHRSAYGTVHRALR